MAYVSFGGGRNDGDTDIVNPIVEILAIQIDIVLDKKIGVMDSNKIRAISYQVSDALHDIQSLINLDNIQNVVHFDETDVQVRDVYLEEWNLDERYRGGPKELLTLTFEIDIGHTGTQGG